MEKVKYIKGKDLTTPEVTMQKTLTLLLFLFSLTLVSAIGNTIPVQIQTTDDLGNIQTGTFEFTLNISNSSTCSPVLYSNISNFTTDNRGIVSYDIEVDLSFDEQYYLCYYRDGVSKDNKTIGTNPYAFRANVSDHWDNLNTINSTQLEDSSGELNIKESWLTVFWNKIFNTKDTDDLAEGSINLYDNQTWNETRATGLYAGIEWGYNQTEPAIIKVTEIDTATNTSLYNWVVAQSYLTEYIETDSLAYNGTLAYLSDIISWNYYNSTNFDIEDYLTSAEVLAFDYYNSTDFDINDYITSTTLSGFDYYNSTDFSIADYSTKTVADTLYAPINYGDDWNKTYADTLYYDIGNSAGYIDWSNVINGTMFSQADWNTNYSTNNDLWLANTQLSDGDITGLGYIKDYTETDSLAYNGTLALTSSLGNYYLNTNPFSFINNSALTDNSMADTLHRHSELSASDGTPDRALVVDSGGRVGIGTTAPTEKLEIKGNSVFRSAGGSAYHNLGNLDWGNLGNSAINARISVIRGGSNFGEGSLVFSTSPDDSGVDERMRITHNGNVGIGTTAPIGKLHVMGDVNVTGNITLGQKITFALGEVIDNIVDGWVRITGGLNVTGDVEVSGGVNVSGDVTATSYKKSCPAGYVAVPHDNLYTFEDFCVMKYEAKCAESATGACGNPGSYLPVSQTANKPWVSVYQYNAREKCEAIGEGYHLITNAEWMTITTNIVKQESNWQGGVVDTGCLFGGHMDNHPPNALAASTDDDSYSGTLNNGSEAAVCPFDTTDGKKASRRTYNLSNGEVIWDISGNVREWTDEIMNVGERPHVAGSNYGWKEYSALNVFRSVRGYEVAMPRDNSFYNSSYGAGQIYTSQGTTGTQLCYSSITAGYTELNCAVYRGGRWGRGVYAGVFCARLDSAPSYSSAYLGFRCSSS